MRCWEERVPGTDASGPGGGARLAGANPGPDVRITTRRCQCSADSDSWLQVQA